MFTPRSFSEAERAEARRRYDAGESFLSIARRLGTTDATLRKYRRKWGWPERSARSGAFTPIATAAAGTAEPRAPGPRQPRRPCDDNGPAHDVSADAGPLEGADTADTTDTYVLSGRIEAAVRRELSGLERRLSGGGDPAEAERNARVLASLVKSLVELNRLNATRGKTAADERESGDGNGTDETSQPPRDMASLRAALAARLERIRAERDPG